MNKELSPMMSQYHRIKEQNKDCILFFRLGDFYEMFFEDAETVSSELDLVLTGKDCGMEKRAPMCGVPYHSCEGYIARLVERGYKVAICEQLEDPAQKQNKVVDRDVVRIITPGTVIEGSMLDEGKNNYLCSLCFDGETVGICFVDASTGDSHVTEISGDEIQRRICDELVRFSPSEIIAEEKTAMTFKLDESLEGRYRDCITLRDKECFSKEHALDMINKSFGVISGENLGIEKDSMAQIALGAAIDYLYENGKNGKITVNTVNYYTEKEFMSLDLTAIRNLELCETMRSKSKKGSLLWVLDKTKTAMGKRLLRSWLLQPLMSITEIALRQNAVEELCNNTVVCGELAEYMSSVRDVERIMTRIVYGSANAIDLLGLSSTAHAFPYIKEQLKNVNCKMLKAIYSDIDPLEEIVELIDASVNPEASASVKDGNIIREGYNKEVDLYRNSYKNSSADLKDIETRERERTGIKNLKVRYNKVFGYYIEVSNSFLDKVPEDYTRKQTLTNGERFITDELKSLEVRVLSSKEMSHRLEYEIFDGIRKRVAQEIHRFKRTAEAIARLDVLRSFAVVAVENSYCRPLVNNSGTVNIKSGRHPVVEKINRAPFVSNDINLDGSNNRCLIITGPNMAGKSTYMRQVALISIMAQMGCYVPAEIAETGVVDAVYTRVGASDDLASGKSTFMVEMSEVAYILKNATKNSLLILDEIGRGTSTYDGMAIAKAVLEYVADKKKLGAKTLFATHYHELTEMEDEISGVKNYNIAVKKRGDDIIFLRRIVRGGADDSYGIEVAKLSGIPGAVTDRAKEILKQIVSQGVVTYKAPAVSSMQMPLEVQGATDILHELQTVDVNTLTPIEAMSMLFDLANKAKSIQTE